MLTFLRAASRFRAVALVRTPAVGPVRAWQQRMTACGDGGGRNPPRPATEMCESKTEESKPADRDGCQESKPANAGGERGCHESQRQTSQDDQSCSESEGSDTDSCSESESSEDEMPKKECPEDAQPEEKPQAGAASQLCDCAKAAVAKAVAGGKKEAAAAVEKKAGELVKKAAAAAPCAGGKASNAQEKKAQEKRAQDPPSAKKSSGAPGPCAPLKPKPGAKPKLSEHMSRCQPEGGAAAAKDEARANAEKCKKWAGEESGGGQDVGGAGKDSKNAPCECMKRALEQCKKDRVAKAQPPPEPKKPKSGKAKPKKAEEKPKAAEEKPKEAKGPCAEPKADSGRKTSCPEPKKSKKGGKSEKPVKKDTKSPKKCDKPNPKGGSKRPTTVCK